MSKLKTTLIFITLITLWIFLTVSLWMIIPYVLTRFEPHSSLALIACIAWLFVAPLALIKVFKVLVFKYQPHKTQTGGQAR